MKRKLCILVFAFCLSGILLAQTEQNLSENEKPKLFNFGIGLGIGIFNPEDINNYITAVYQDIDPAFGTYNMMMYFALNASGSFFFTRYTELQLESEWAFSSKLISLNGNMESFFYQRITPALKFNFHIPFNNKASFFIGSGASYSYLFFRSPVENYNGNTPGFSGQAGIMLRFRKIAIQPGFTMNFIKADANNTDPFLNGYNISFLDELSFTGGQIGCKLMF